MQSQDNQPPGNNEATLIAPRAQQGVARLILRRPDGQLQEFGLDKDEFTIGRLSTSDLVLQDDRSVSRRHAVIRRSNAGYVIEDLQSNNGTYVDGERVEYPIVLRNGQSIKVGDNELTFKIISAPLSAAAPSGPAAGAPGQMPSEPPAPTYDLPVPGAGQAPAFQPGFNPPAFDALAQPAFGGPPPAQPAFGGPPPAQPAFDAPSPPFGGPPQPFPGQQPAPFGAPPGAAPGAPPAPASSGPAAASGPSSTIICQVCHQPTQANKAFCLNCGSSLLTQQQQVTPGGPPPFGGPPPAPGGFAPNQMNAPADAPPAWQPPPPPGQPAFGGPPPGPMPGGPPPGQPFGGPPVGGPPGQPFGGPPLGQPAFGGPPPGQPAFGGPPVGGPPPGQPAFGGPPPGQPAFGGPPPGQPAWQPPQPPGPPFGGPPPGPPFGGPPGQPFGGPPPQGQFAPPGAVPGMPQGGPVVAEVFFPRGMRPWQVSDIVVRLTTQFPAPGPLQPGMQVSVRIWAAAPDALSLGGPGLTMRVPGPGQVEEASIKVTPIRETPRGLTDQIFFQLHDAASGQPLQPTPAVAEVVISQQPIPQFDGPGSIRLPI